jgi:adenylate cyclase
MNRLLSRRRFEVLALSIALVMAGLHGWASAVPVGGVRLGADGRPAEEAGGLTQALLRSVHTLEGRASDVQVRLRGPRAPHPDVVVVAIDEESIQRFGLFPWSRALVARGLLGLHRAGASAVGLDVTFTNESPDGAGQAYREVLARFEQASRALPEASAVQLAAFRAELAERTRSSPDADLAAAFREAPEVVQGLITYPLNDRASFGARAEEHAALLAGRLLVPPFPGRVPGSVYEVPLEQVPSWVQHSAQTPLRPFVEAGSPLGLFNVSPDPDGVIRRLPLFARLDSPKGLLPSLALQTAATGLGARVVPDWDPVAGRLVGARLERAGAPALAVPLLEDEPFALVNFYGKGDRTFRHVSFADAVDGTLAPGALEGKLAVLGVTYVGGFDQRVTPFSEYEPGVYLHAGLLSNILSQDFLRRPVSLRVAELAFMLLSALALAVLLPRVNFALKLGLVLAGVAGWLALDQALLNRGVQLATVLPSANLLAVSFGVIFLGYLSVDREKGQLRHAFQHYLNPSVMEQMLQHPEKLKLGGEKKEMSVLFSDIRGFTTLSERMAPEALVKFINAYLTPMTGIVFEEGGTLDKYIGDALMAFWGAPVDQPDHALRACRAAVRMLDELGRLKAAWREQNLPDFDIGVGINSGPMIVGNMGSDIRFDYTVMGDAVNLASRLEGTNKEYETRVLISEATFRQVEGRVVARRLGAVRVKGKRKPVGIYELRGLGVAEGRDAEAVRAFEAAVDHFAAQRFDEAEAGFTSVLGLWPDDPPSHRYLQQIADFREEPPAPGWDGVYTATTK